MRWEGVGAISGGGATTKLCVGFELCRGLKKKEEKKKKEKKPTRRRPVCHAHSFFSSFFFLRSAAWDPSPSFTTSAARRTVALPSPRTGTIHPRSVPNGATNNISTHGCSTVVLVGFTCPAITVVTVPYLRALDRIPHRRPRPPPPPPPKNLATHVAAPNHSYPGASRSDLASDPDPVCLALMCCLASA